MSSSGQAPETPEQPQASPVLRDFREVAPIFACLPESVLRHTAGQNLARPVSAELARQVWPDPARPRLSGQSGAKKKGGRSPLSVSPSRLISLTARCLFACGLDVAWNERTRSVKEWEGANIPPHPVPGQHGHVGRVKKGHLVSLVSFLRIRRGRLPRAASDPYAPGCRGANPTQLSVGGISPIRFFGDSLVGFAIILDGHKLASALVTLLPVSIITLKLSTTSHSTSAVSISSILCHFAGSLFTGGRDFLLVSLGTTLYFQARY